MNIFKGQNLVEYSDRFQTDDSCKEYLTEIKSKTAYKCLKYGHKACQKRKNLSTECNICRYIESPTANTLFNMF